MITKRALTWVLAAGLAAAVGCSKDEGGEGAEGEGEKAEQAEDKAPQTPEEKWQAKVEEIEKSLAEQAKSRKLRLVETKTAGEGEDKAYSFELTNTADKPIEWGQAWVYYYDEDGKCVDRYPHSFVEAIGPGETAKLELGKSPDRMKDGVASADLEISAVRFDDDSEWANENLVQATFDREKGGLDAKALKEREGEKVVGEWTGEYGEEGKPTFRLTNIAGKTAELRTVWIYYYDDEGEVVDRDVANVRGTEIEADATIEWEGGRTKDEQKEKVTHIEPSVSRIEIDGEEWENENLSDTERPARALPEA